MVGANATKNKRAGLTSPYKRGDFMKSCTKKFILQREYNEEDDSIIHKCTHQDAVILIGCDGDITQNDISKMDKKIFKAIINHCQHCKQAY